MMRPARRSSKPHYRLGLCGNIVWLGFQVRPSDYSGSNIVRTGCDSHRGGRRFAVHRDRPIRGLSPYSLVYLRLHTCSVGCCYPRRANGSTSAPADAKRIGPRGCHRADDCERRAMDRPKSISQNRRSSIRARNPIGRHLLKA
jgi:hypothetical protein